MWNRVLASIEKVNISIQSKSVSLDGVSKMLKDLIKPIQTMRDEGIDSVVDYGKHTAEVMGIEPNFPDKRRRKIKI